MSFHVTRIKPEIYHTSFFGHVSPENIRQALTLSHRYAQQHDDDQFAFIIDLQGACRISDDVAGYFQAVMSSPTTSLYVVVGLPDELKWVGCTVASLSRRAVHYAQTPDEAVRIATREHRHYKNTMTVPIESPPSA